uniref:Integrase zinc-binding domain-containing protein n=1 Tax=Anopheles arabiensis TaxID=7173 RepID=A0A182HXZ8_ANOAR
EISVPRLVAIAHPDTIQLHGFGDASESGYGACVYVRSIDSAGTMSSRLFVSKSKVAPLSKKHTIARLELCAAHLLSKLITKVKKTINMETLMHGGAQIMINTIQQKYWIVGGRNVVKSIIHNCMRCTRCKPRLLQQPMADLPLQR